MWSRARIYLEKRTELWCELEGKEVRLLHLFMLKVVRAGTIHRDEITRGEEVEWVKERTLGNTHILGQQETS